MITETADHQEKMMRQIHNNVDLLSQDNDYPHWQDQVIDGVPAGKKLVQVKHKALLEQLRNSIRSSLGQTESGRSAPDERSALNLAAFTLYENIDGLIRSHHGYLTGKPGKGDPEHLLRLWYIEFANQHRAGSITDIVLARTRNMIAKWVRDIQNLYDPETVKELIGVCPNCDQRYFYDMAEDVLRSALYAHYRADNTPEAQCRCCGAQWWGAKELRELGYHIGATVDEDLLTEMGAI